MGVKTGPSRTFPGHIDSVMRGCLGGVDIRTKTRCWNDSGGAAVITLDLRADLSQVMEIQTRVAHIGKGFYINHQPRQVLLWASVCLLRLSLWGNP